MINFPEVDTVLPADPEAPSNAHPNRSPMDRTRLPRSPPQQRSSKPIKLVCRPEAKASPPPARPPPAQGASDPSGTSGC